MLVENKSSESFFYLTEPELNLSEIQHTFDNIPSDPYFAGKYRGRTQSRIHINVDGSFELKPRKPLYQNNQINSLEKYGGITRHYEDVPKELIECDAFQVLVNHWRTLLPFSISQFSVHQIRTVGAGQSVPEGRHRDGYDWVGVFVVNRVHLEADSGCTTVWWGLTDEVLFEGVMTSGQLVTFDDSVFMHDVTAISPTTVTKLAYRDVLIFTTPEHGEMVETGGNSITKIKEG
jgi:hypothetical protein